MPLGQNELVGIELPVNTIFYLRYNYFADRDNSISLIF